MINFIEKALKFVCLCIGIVILSILSFCALCGDFGIIPMKIALITLMVISVLSLTDFFKGVNKAKRTPLFGDED